MAVYGYIHIMEGSPSELCKAEVVQRRAINFFGELHSLWIDDIFVEHSYDTNSTFSQRFEGRRLLSVLKASDTIIAYGLDRIFNNGDDAGTLLKQFRDQKIDLQLIDFGGTVVKPPLSNMVIRLLSQAA